MANNKEPEIALETLIPKESYVEAVGLVFLIFFVSLIVGKTVTSILGIEDKKEKKDYDMAAIALFIGLLGFTFAVSQAFNDKDFFHKIPPVIACLALAALGANMFVGAASKLPKVVRFVKRKGEGKWWEEDEDDKNGDKVA